MAELLRITHKLDHITYHPEAVILQSGLIAPTKVQTEFVDHLIRRANDTIITFRNNAQQERHVKDLQHEQDRLRRTLKRISGRTTNKIKELTAAQKRFQQNIAGLRRRNKKGLTPHQWGLLKPEDVELTIDDIFHGRTPVANVQLQGHGATEEQETQEQAYEVADELLAGILQYD